ncbi:hypothetical protein [Xanthocytophaga agilis]|uniref:Uncharacterized protein n=1 Tax=Xanthocytophaga agilis TaxID=3048010 RepID=A0AAE3UE38_9BACT|nr:hypothetical protein [Xanthocytophaga agilis]MDJ1499847.1 hypothetical protein [Xanthocytophaga agilis]
MTEDQLSTLIEKLDFIIDKQSRIEARLEKIEGDLGGVIHDIKKIKKRVRKEKGGTDELKKKAKE